MAKKDDDLIFEASTRADRPVLNQEDTPEFINLATHYKEKGPKPDPYETLQFTDGSVDFRNRFEDQAVIKGKVKPNPTGDVRKVQGRAAVTSGKSSSDFIPPYRDIPGRYASVDDKAPEPVKDVRYVTIPSSMAFIYNPAVLIAFAVMLMLLIAVEILGVIYVF